MPDKHGKKQRQRQAQAGSCTKHPQGSVAAGGWHLEERGVDDGVGQLVALLAVWGNHCRNANEESGLEADCATYMPEVYIYLW